MKFATFVLMTVIFLSGCSKKEELNKLKTENTQLQESFKRLNDSLAQRNAYVQEYSETINEVFSNLERIRKREGFLTQYSRDLEHGEDGDLKQKILTNIASIDSYLKSSKARLADLKRKEFTARQRNSALEETVQSLSRALDEKERFIVQMREQVNQLNERVAVAEQQVQEQGLVIDEQSRMLNTGYYIIGTESELKEKGIIIEEGGFLGINKTRKLAPGFSKQDFIRMDIASTNAISIEEDMKRLKLISPHSLDSFHLVQMERKHTMLEIVDPQEFWKIKYLVILTKG